MIFLLVCARTTANKRLSGFSPRDREREREKEQVHLLQSLGFSLSVSLSTDSLVCPSGRRLLLHSSPFISLSCFALLSLVPPLLLRRLLRLCLGSFSCSHVSLSLSPSLSTVYVHATKRKGIPSECSSDDATRLKGFKSFTSLLASLSLLLLLSVSLSHFSLFPVHAVHVRSLTLAAAGHENQDKRERERE